MAKKVNDLKLRNEVLKGIIEEINDSIAAYDASEKPNVYRLLGKIETISKSFEERLRYAQEDQQRGK